MEENINEPQIFDNPPQQDDKPSELAQQLEQTSNDTGHNFNPFENSSKSKKKNPTKRLLLVIVSVLGVILLLSGTVIAYDIYVENTNQNTDTNTNTGIGNFPFNIQNDKPVIYLYPTKTQNVKVELNLHGELTSAYPDYIKSINGWEVTANPDGSLINLKDGKEYSYLFWEGLTDSDYSNLDTGFVVKGSETKDFLQSTLARLGLTAKEYNEMIVYWLPKMENNKFNLIYFAGKEYTDNAKLTITPTPDSILRVFMVFKPLDKYRQIQPQQLESFERKGFTVVEWGGTEIK